ncbi:MAG TPA: hypothetical protein VLI90_02970, partial [Tepidisphaeraceae bacterium]|nr:hypothetical protein [Tepidisphaeraceae bacterium]
MIHGKRRDDHRVTMEDAVGHGHRMGVDRPSAAAQHEPRFHVVLSARLGNASSRSHELARRGKKTTDGYGVYTHRSRAALARGPLGF